MSRLKALPPRVTGLQARVKAPEKVADPFYLTREWREFVGVIKRQRGFVCEVPACGKDCSATPRGLIGDHIVERKDGGADFDPGNVMLMCTGCHNRKTAVAALRRARRAV